MRIGFGVDQAGIAIARTASNTWAILPISFIEHHSKRRVKRIQPEAREIVAQLLNARLVTNRRIRKCTAAARFGKVFPGFTMHMVNAFRFGVVWLQFVVRNRPGWRDSTEMFYLAKIFFAESEKCSAIKFSIAPDIIIGVRMKL